MTLAKRAVARKKEASIRPRSSARPDPLALLAWYDRHRRILPWRARPGEAIDPYRVWLSEIMLQQTTVKAVAPYFARFIARWPNVQSLAKAPLEDVLKGWAGLGYYARARNLHACAQAVAKTRAGKFPQTVEALRELPGVGDYTAAAIAAIAFDQPAVPVDGNVERVVARIYAVEESLPAAKPKLRALAAALMPPARYSDFAQALMDLGATICTPKTPACSLCPWNADCAAHARGEEETFPRKTPKREGQLRRGAAFVALREDGCVLLRRRPEKGLLAGMSEVPGSDWHSEMEEATMRRAAPKLIPPVPWRRLAGSVEHVFTHFPLTLSVYFAQVPRRSPPPSGMRWVRRRELPGEALPSVMRKVIAHALEEKPR
ncbi:MAG: A/G-specific adenine glycosylase [Pseudolabrys sp.]|nr:A/G-specific adenine glycosylase [Pseudolabrys sp.]MBV9955027.1 A/G-specific adenine glycosylase [Pseudolabrys sp.]